MAKPKSRPAKAPVSKASSGTSTAEWWPDALNLGFLSAMAMYLGYAAWGNGPDPLIDFGRELYLPWRLAQGAVLYKDDLHLYGPFSPYLNSLWFRISGASLTTLLKANAVIYASILALMYFLVRVAWGRFTALVSVGFFVGVFSFAHLVRVANYTFLTPYSHELTHGILLILCLVFTLWKTVESLNTRWAAGAGLLAGLSLLMKPEIIFTAALVVAAAGILIVMRSSHLRPRGSWLRTSGVFAAAAILPMTIGGLLFWGIAGFPLREAFYRVNYAWLVVFEFLNLENKDFFQQAALGLDEPWRNLATEVMWGTAAVGLPAGLALGVRRFGRATNLEKTVFILLLLMCAAGAVWVPWTRVGSALPLILTCGLVMEFLRRHTVNNSTLRLLLWVSAGAMLARMAFNPRISHYGFAQAALAGVVSVAFLESSLPDFFRLDRSERRWYRALITILILATIGVVASSSIRLYGYHDFQVGLGADRFFALGSNVHPSGLLVEEARQFLARDAEENKTKSLLVLPEGIILNYLTRLPNPIPYYFFAPFVLADGRQEDMMRQLNETPPDRIVLISRDMREYGVKRFGDSPENGKKLADFVTQNYQAIYAYGDNPVEPDQFGFIVFGRKEFEGR